MNRIVAFVRIPYDATLNNLALLPSAETKVVFPDWDYGGVTQSRMNVAIQGFKGNVEVTRSNVKYYRLLDPYFWTLAGKSINSTFVYSDVQGLVSDADVCIVAEPYTFTSLQVARACKRSGTKLVVMAETHPELTLPKLMPYLLNAKIVTSLADICVPSTVGARRYLQGLGQSTISSVTHHLTSIERDRFSGERYDAGSKAITILFIGRLECHKGFHVLLSALKKLSKEIRLELLAIGQGELSALLREDWGVQVRHVPFADAASYPKYFRSADIFCLPSTRVSRLGFTSWVEIFGISAWEAMAAALPIIVTTSGNLPQIAQGLNPVVPERDVTSLAASIRSLAENPQLRSEIGNLNRARAVERFCRESIRKRWYSIIPKS
ncbi:MAG: glycosyltransferase family 4 protein [Nitrososphaerota archaeon]|nr:glycosyltransferase family 4 protein [Nitrososphaerota archaeon]